MRKPAVAMALSVAWNTPRYASIERTYAAMSTAHSKQTCNLFLGRPRTTQLQYNHYNYCLPFKMGLDNNRLYLLRGSHWLYHIRRTWGEFLRTVSSHFSRTIVVDNFELLKFLHPSRYLPRDAWYLIYRMRFATSYLI